MLVKYIENIDLSFAGMIAFCILMVSVFLAFVIFLQRQPDMIENIDMPYTFDGFFAEVHQMAKELPLPDVHNTHTLPQNDGDVKKKKKKKHRKKKKSKYEEQCRKIFETIFLDTFPDVRPDWLQNPVTGANLELDGYCEKLMLAFEYDGKQHDTYTPHFHTNKRALEYQQEKDAHKDKVCLERGIDLIRIPHTVRFVDLKDYIEEELVKYGRLS